MLAEKVENWEYLAPMKAIRKKCLECVCGSAQEVRDCHMKDCPLWGHRLGKRAINPNYVKTPPSK